MYYYRSKYFEEVIERMVEAIGKEQINTVPLHPGSEPHDYHAILECPLGDPLECGENRPRSGGVGGSTAHEPE